MSKNLYIISGCNGAGKTTASYTVLPEILDCREFVNADEIARGLSPFNPESVAIEAGKLMLQRIEDLLAKDETFSIETTLATKSYIDLVRRAQAKGYVVKVLFFWLNSPELALLRIAERVSKGGHNIPEEIVRRRYSAGINNLFHLFMDEAMSNKELNDFSEKLRNGLKLAEKRMLEEKAIHGEDIIVSSDGVTFMRIPAKQVIAENSVFQD